MEGPLLPSPGVAWLTRTADGIILECIYVPRKAAPLATRSFHGFYNFLLPPSPLSDPKQEALERWGPIQRDSKAPLNSSQALMT